jgi:hypothetical protein
MLDEAAVEHHRREHRVTERMARLHLVADGAQPFAEQDKTLTYLAGAEAIDFAARVQASTTSLFSSSRARETTGERLPDRPPAWATELRAGTPARRRD